MYGNVLFRDVGKAGGDMRCSCDLTPERMGEESCMAIVLWGCPFSLKSEDDGLMICARPIYFWDTSQFGTSSEAQEAGDASVGVFDDIV